MPVLVIEGPDESGKTTLAREIHSRLVGQLPVEFQRSPVKEHGWSYSYNHYLTDLIHIADQQDTLFIQDRIPEISESVYGVLRGTRRNYGWSHELYNWLGHDLMFVFCLPARYNPTQRHRDAMRRDLTQTDHQIVYRLYELVYHDIESAVFSTRAPMVVLKYEMGNRQSTLGTMWSIRDWLRSCTPHHREEISRAMHFNLNDKIRTDHETGPASSIPSSTPPVVEQELPESDEPSGSVGDS